MKEFERLEVFRAPTRLQEIDKKLIQLHGESEGGANAMKDIEEVSSASATISMPSNRGNNDEDEMLVSCDIAEESRQLDSSLQQAEESWLQVDAELRDNMDEVKTLDEACPWDDNIHNSSDEMYDNDSEESSPAQNSNSTVTELSLIIETHHLPTNIRGENLKESPLEEYDVTRVVI